MLMNTTIEKSRYGCPQPQIELFFDQDTSTREANAILHQLAAAVERATLPAERWIVQVEGWNAGELHDRRIDGRVYLELHDATPAEAKRGLATLERVAKEIA